MEKIKKLNIQKLFVVFIIIQPIIDIITSILVRHVSNVLTLGIFIRAVFMIAIILYSLIISDKKYRIKMLVYYVIFAIYSLCFVITMYKVNGTNMIFSQIKGLIKCFYLPIVIVALYPIMKQKKVHIDNKIFIYALLGYTVTIFVTRIFGIAYPTYSIGLNVGTTGLFYAANEIGIILGILAIFLFNNMFLKPVENLKDRILYIVSIFLYIFSILEMGTKVPILAFAGIFIITTIVCIVKIFKIDKKMYLKKLIGLVILTIIIVLCVPYTAVGKNVERNYGVKFFKILDINFKEPSQEVIPSTEEKKFANKEEVTTAVVSSRNLFLKDNLKLYNNSSTVNKIIGIGYVDNSGEQFKDIKTIEIDYFDIFILQGIFGALLFFTPILIILFIIVKRSLLNIKKIFLNEDIIAMYIGIGLSACVAMLAGHTLVAPAVSIYIAVILINLLSKVEEIE